jgi:hypothetical protein
MWYNIIVYGRIVILVWCGPSRFRGPTRFPRLKGGAPLVVMLSPTINRPCIQSRIQASIDPIILHLPKSRVLEFLILKHNAKWRPGRHINIIGFF